jgi:pre-mRNA-processing factor 39
MKERIVATLVSDHEKCESQVEKRQRFEDKIKRPYFHVRPLDLKQLKNWENYLDFELLDGDHERIVVLFERCLIPCAKYEQFWAKYAAYLERHYKNGRGKQ